MEGSDFDYYAQNRPEPEDFPSYEPQQPQIPAQTEKEPEKKKKLSSGTKLILITFGICVLIVVGVLLLALIDPVLNKIDLDVSINRGGSTSGGTMYVDTDNIEIVIRNHGSEVADGSKITLKVSGDNIAEETIQWTGGDIPTDKSRAMTISVDVENEFESFTLKISIYYDGDFQSKDQIP
jgi:hypothetical protein